MNTTEQITSWAKELQFNNLSASFGSRPIFIADIGANHDGDISKAIDLIHLAKESGADVAKFQHFSASTIVSDIGFKRLGEQIAHQKSWTKSVYEVYEAASINSEWNDQLYSECKNCGIAFMTSPYDHALVEQIDGLVECYKIGSGDITWHDLITHICKKNKPYLLATGASNLEDVISAVEIGLAINRNICLMQCNTNYTGSPDNIRYSNLNVLRTFASIYPGMVLGLSDHTPGDLTVLGAISLGASVIEKHFTINTDDEGPDHFFAMDPLTWKQMVKKALELHSALGDGHKVVEQNELDASIVQRRALRLKNDLKAGHIITLDDIIALRPCPMDALPPYLIKDVVNKELQKDIKSGEHITWEHLRA